MIKRFFKDARGATAIEYGLIATLIAASIIGGVTALGDSSVVQLEGVADKF